MLGVLGLVQTVGIDEQLPAAYVVDALALEGVVLPEAERLIGVLHLEELSVEHRRVVTAVAEVQLTGVQIEQADKHRDEHAAVVVLRQLIIHSYGYIHRREAFSGQCAEQAGRLRHEERGRHTLAADIAHTEVELVALQDIAVQVTADLLGGVHLGIHV